MTYRRSFLQVWLPVLLVSLITALPARSQELDADGLRIGVGFAGTGLLSLLVEYRWGGAGLDLALSTISFRDVGLYAGGRAYLGGASPQPVAGLGLWGLVAGGEERNGAALVLRAPIGIDWRVGGGHSVGFNIALNRALLIRRSDPGDDEPPNSRLVPLPALEYRYRTN